MPPATIDAFRDHGVVRRTIDEDVARRAAACCATSRPPASRSTRSPTSCSARASRRSRSRSTEITDTTAKKAEQDQGEGERRVKFDLGALRSDAVERARRRARRGATPPGASGARDADVLGRRRRAPGVGRQPPRLARRRVADARARSTRSTRFAEQVRADGFRDAVLLGMGGSSLAPEVLRQSIRPRATAGWPALHVLDTTDPATIARRRARDRRRADAVLRLVEVRHDDRGAVALRLLPRASSQTREAGPRRRELRRHHRRRHAARRTLAREHGFRHVFTNPGDIGGRYSALSYFGLVPGRRRRRRRRRGCSIAASLRRSEPRAGDSEALRLGAALGELARAGRDKCTFVMSPRIASFGLWVEQLIAESTGKLGTGILPVAGEPLGTPQHYGDDRVFVQLRLDGDANAEDDAARRRARGRGASGDRHRPRRRVRPRPRVLPLGVRDRRRRPGARASTRSTSRTCRSRRTTPTACSRSSRRRGKLDVEGIDATPGSPR